MSVPINLDQLEARILGRQAGMHWYTLIVEAQSWNRVAERAGEMGYETYCPMGLAAAARIVRGARTLPDIARPLMPGYLFVDMPGPRRRFDLFAEGIRGSRGFLALDGSPMALHEAVIAEMKAREAAGEFDFTGLTDNGRHRVPKWVKLNARVRCIFGPFAGLSGYIKAVRNARSVKVVFPFFGSEITSDVQINWLQPCSAEDAVLLILEKKHAKA